MILYRNSYVEDERLFSTGDSELDDILEEVYYSGLEDGYEYAQKEFAAVPKLAPKPRGPKIKGVGSKRDNKKFLKTYERFRATGNEAGMEATANRKYSKGHLRRLQTQTWGGYGENLKKYQDKWMIRYGRKK